MPRELKFRVWNEDKSEFMPSGFIGILDGKFIDLKNGSVHFDSDDKIIEQFTGIKDANGKDIYEGDIVEYGSFEVKRFEVKFGVATEFNSDPYYPVKFVGWYAHETDDIEDFLHSGDIGKSVVIGNIHENVDLSKNLGLQK